MKKTGFTLAEVLITLGIIGVVAALTTPALVKNTGSAKVGPTLAKFVNSVETAAEQLMHDENIGKLSDAFYESANGANYTLFGDHLSRHMIMTPLTDKNYVAYAPDGTTEYNTYPGENAKLWQLKDGSVLVLTKADDFASLKNNPQILSLKGPMFALLYDIDGMQGKNSAGRDLYFFILDDTGTMVAAGSKAFKAIYDTADKSGNFNSVTSCSTIGSSAAAGLICTGEIADNGWKTKK